MASSIPHIQAYRMYWTVHLEGGPRRVNHAAVVVLDKIYSFGGYCTGENYQRKRPMDVHILNTGNYRWHALPTPEYNDVTKITVPYQRYGHTAVEHEQKIYIWGGRNDEAACNRLFCFNPDNLTWSSPKVSGMIPAARDGHSACVINNQMFVFGGFEEQMDRFSQDVYALDLRTMVWRYIITQGDPPSYRDFHSANAIDDRMYIFGGRGDVYGPYHSQEELYSNSIMYLDTATGVWHQPRTTGDIPLGRRSHSAFVYKNSLYVFGGYNGLCDEHFNDLYQFSPVTNTWTLMQTLGKPPSRRRRQSCLVVGDRVFLFGGTSPYQGQMSYQVIEDLYNEGIDSKLMDHNDMHILDFAPSLRTLCAMIVINNQLDYSSLPEELRWELRVMVTPNSISRPLNNTG
ncbi:kelch domain-containing protein 3 isoform X1 [Schistocerca serialis cubense]|uniref:kelch domain-containing protein 3 isoform X1 n=2 Tax=Schistocerca serialis cubense TaxID=2023355 RepID=UPI00214E2B1F|nr:kelch domain-containing protein 3 isoform X1 [Schistocerca serialis cubense]